jgi:hypothetical protein
MTKELLRMVFNFYEFYDKLSLSFPSESYVRNNLEIIDVSLYKRGGTQILNDEGEVIGVNRIQENYFNFKRNKQFPSRSSTEEDAVRRKIGKRVRISRDDNSPDDESIGTLRPSIYKSPSFKFNEINNTPRLNNNNSGLGLIPRLEISCEDNFICSVMDVNKNKRFLRSSVRKDKSLPRNNYISPIILSDDNNPTTVSVSYNNEPSNNNILGMSYTCPESSVIAMLTTSTSLIKAIGGTSEHFMS